MITLFRNFARSKWAIGLLALLALGLVVTGGTQMDVLGQLSPPHVIDAGSRSVTPAEFRADIDRRRQQAQQQTGRPITNEQIVESGELGNILRTRSQELGLLAWLHRLRVIPATELVLREIRKIPAFFDPVSQQFSQEAYVSALAQQNLTPAQVEEEIRDEYARIHYVSALGAGARLPRVYGSVIANQTRQTRDGRWFILTQAMAGTAGQPTDAQLNAFIQQNAARLRTPELRTGTLVIFGAANPAQPTEAAIQERFEFRREALARPERRTFTTLTAPNRETAQRIAQALRGGQTAQAVGEANNLQPSVSTETPRSAVSDPAVAAAVFGLSSGQVSDPIQARVGFVVAQVTAIEPGQDVTLADVREQIVAELQEEANRAETFRQVEAYEAARREGRTFDQAVQQVGARTVQIPALSREGRNADGQQVSAPAQVLDAMYSLSPGTESDVNNVGEGQYFVVRLDRVLPAALPALDTLRPQLTQAWVAQENARLLSSRADALAARLRGGEDITAVAASVGAQVTTQTGVVADQPTAESLGRGVIGGLFATERGRTFSQQQTADSYALGRVDRITAPSPAVAAQDAVQWRARMSGEAGQLLFQAALPAVGRRMKVEFDEALAREALGVTAQAPASGAAPAKK